MHPFLGVAIWRFTFKWVYQFVSDPHPVPRTKVPVYLDYLSWLSVALRAGNLSCFWCHGVPVVSGGLGDKLGGGRKTHETQKKGWNKSKRFKNLYTIAVTKKMCYKNTVPKIT